MCKFSKWLSNVCLISLENQSIFTCFIHEKGKILKYKSHRWILCTRYTMYAHRTITLTWSYFEICWIRTQHVDYDIYIYMYIYVSIMISSSRFCMIKYSVHVMCRTSTLIWKEITSCMLKSVIGRKTTNFSSVFFSTNFRSVFHICYK